MSLINDALRQAKANQQPAEPQPGPSPLFRPVEPARQSSFLSLGLVLPAGFAVVALVALFFAWRYSQSSSADEMKVRASSQETVAAAATVQDTTALAAAPAAPVVAPAPVASVGPVGVAGTLSPAPLPAANAADTNAATQAVAATPVAPPAAPEPPKLPPMKLQAIVFSPTRPSAMINGRTVFLGDKVGELRVSAIGQDSATLVGAGLTNVLVLPPQ